MVNSGRREDDMLDLISKFRTRRDNALSALEFLQVGHLIEPEAASIIWEALTGVNEVEEGSESDGDAVHRSEPVR